MDGNSSSGIVTAIATVTAAVLGASAVIWAAIVAIKGKRIPDVTALETAKIAANTALTERLSKEIDSLHAIQAQQAKDLKEARDENFATQRKMLEQEVAFTKQIAELQDGTRAQRIQYEETVSKLQDDIVDLKTENENLKTSNALLTSDNSTLREQVSTLQRNLESVSAALRAKGGSPEEAVKANRRSTDKKGSES